MTEETLRYDPTAAQRLLKAEHLHDIEPRLLGARQEVLDDAALLRSGDEIPADKQPLDAGFYDMPQRLLDEYDADGSNSELGRILQTAAMFREELDAVVSLGIGGSYMGARALFEALCSPWHNELSRQQRGGVPRIYFEGHNVDNDSLQALLSLLQSRWRNAGDVAQRWGIIVISKSGGTLETAVAFRLFRLALEASYGSETPDVRRLIVPITGRTGRLRTLAENKGYENVFDVPEGIGGRFSVLTAVGLFPAAVMGLDVLRLLEGALAMNRRFCEQPFGNNPVLDYTALCHLFETLQGLTIRVLSTWGSRLESLGFWYDQLLSESLGKEERGATPLTVVNTRDLHSRGQQHQQGRRDKLITNLVVENPNAPPLSVPECPQDDEKLNHLAGQNITAIQQAAWAGTNLAYAEDSRPTADIRLPRLNEYVLGQLFQFFMLSTVLEGRLMGINPYGQPGVEAYKRNMTRLLQGGSSR